MLDKTKALRVEGKRLVFRCTDCPTEISVVTYPKVLREHRGMCRSCSSRKNGIYPKKFFQPFEAAYRYLEISAARHDLPLEITFSQFLSLTEVPVCHYCEARIEWDPWESAYRLDRKNNDLGYTMSNVTVCCWVCNRMKGNRYSYDDMLLLGAALKQIRENREHEAS